MDYLGFAIGTAQDKTYRTKVLECLNCLCGGEYEWVESTKPIKGSRKPYDSKSYDPNAKWYFLKIKRARKDEHCQKLEQAIARDVKTDFIYLAPDDRNGKTTSDNGGALGQGNRKSVVVNPDAAPMVPTEVWDEHGEPKAEKGKPIYEDKAQPFCAFLWHELMGHAVNEVRIHPDEPWNDETEYDNRPNRLATSEIDKALAEENWARKKLGLPLRRPRYWDAEHRPPSAP